MNFIPQSILDEILSKLDIINIAGKYIELKRAGENYKALCPFHSEKTPSFVISPAKQIFHCFGCGEGGNLIKFVMNIENINFIEAVKLLAKDAGVYIDMDDKLMDQEAKLAKKKSKMRELMAIVSSIYSDELKKSIVASDYLSEREIGDDIISEFHIGFAKSGSLLNSPRFSKSDIPLLIEAGALQRDSRGNIFEKFRNRIIFPITDSRKRTIGFGGRILPGNNGAKYLNSPDTPIFKKGNTFYGIEQCFEWVRKTSEVILVEGYIDLISMYKNGYKNVLAGLGTALTLNQVKLLKRSAEDIFMLYDNDSAGEKACLRAGSIFSSEGVLTSVVKIKQKDPDDFFKDNPSDGIKKIMTEKYSYLEYKLDILNKGLKTSNIIDMEKISKNIISTLEDAQNISPIVYESLLKKWSDEYSINPVLLKKNKKSTKKNKKILDESRSMNKIERDIVKLMIKNNEFEDEIKEAGQEILDYFQEPLLKEIIKTVQDSDDGHRWHEYLSNESKSLFEELSCSTIEDFGENERAFWDENLEKLKNKYKKIKLSAIRNKIKEAGLKKDYEEVKKWQKLYTKLNKE